MYVKDEVGGKKLPAMMDIGEGTMYMAKGLTDEISLPYKEKKGYMKGVNEKSLLIYIVA